MEINEPCPDHICDGSGRVEDFEGEWEDCPHIKDIDQHDPDRDELSTGVI